jgi:hypothetical protein
LNQKDLIYLWSLKFEGTVTLNNPRSCRSHGILSRVTQHKDSNATTMFRFDLTYFFRVIAVKEKNHFFPDTKSKTFFLDGDTT